MTVPPGARRADVELRLPADNVYVSVLRTTAAGLAARLDFTLDEIEDLKMAVGEASSLVLAGAGADSDLTSGFHLGDGELSVVVGVDAEAAPAPDVDSFAWQVLTTLADQASYDVDGGRFAITLSMRSELRGTAD
jgi:serine/threonine-protein kinase RsbW